MDLPPPTSGRIRKHLAWKLRKIRYPLARIDDLRPLTIAVENPEAMGIYVSAATWHGEQNPSTAMESGRQEERFKT